MPDSTKPLPKKIPAYTFKIHDEVYQMETFSALLAICAGKFTGHRWIPRTKASDAELWCFLWSASEKKRLSKQSWGCWFETLSRLLWRHCNVNTPSCRGHRVDVHYQSMSIPALSEALNKLSWGVHTMINNGDNEYVEILKKETLYEAIYPISYISSLMKQFWTHSSKVK